MVEDQDSKSPSEKNPFGFDTYQRDEKLVKSAITIAQNHFELHYNAYYSSQKLVYVEVELRAVFDFDKSQSLNWKEALHGFYNELKENGLAARRISNQKLSREYSDDKTVIGFVIGRLPPAEEYDLRWNFGLLAATLITIFVAGWFFATSPVFVSIYAIENPLPVALMFLGVMFGVIGIHELGHLTACKIHGVESTLPYFLPLPPVLGFEALGGTLGAVIRQRSPSINRDVLFDIGFAGPLFGLLTSIVVTIIGIQFSIVLPMTFAEFQALYPNTGLLPTPLLFDWIMMIFSPETSGGVLFIHPITYAGWIGMLITALNLFPASQLDGGHVARAVLGPKYHRWATFLVIIILSAIGLFTMALFLLFISWGSEHPGPLDDVSPLSRGRQLLSLVMIPLVIICLPFQIF
ncbi:MAG: site-2 protease family protein [Candidatus Ranarchaeia archaeon]